MTEIQGRRQRKKAATRQAIADAALRLFLERGFDAVGVREVAKEADVALTTLFLHFGSKEALVFDEDQSREQRLVAAVTDREADESIPEALRRELQSVMCEVTSSDAAAFWALVDESQALRQYAATMWLRHEEALAGAIAADLGHADVPMTCRAFARFVLDVHSLARDAPDAAGAVDEIFDLIGAAWHSVASA